MGQEIRVGLACNRATLDLMVASDDRSRMERLAEFVWQECDEPSSWDEAPPYDPAASERLTRFAEDLDGLIVCHGAPFVSGDVMAAAPRVRIIGELEGDRFARRVDVEAAAELGIPVVDTTHASSPPVAEWALGLMLIGLRNAGHHFRAMIAGQRPFPTPDAYFSDPGFIHGDLSGKTVGLIGCGYIGRRLLELLRPFRVTAYVHDPYVPRELADVYDITFTTLDHVLSGSDVVVSLVPITAATRGMLGARELALLRPGTVFVNVSRGAVVQTPALLDRLAAGDIVACLDVFDPEPVPTDSPILGMPNVFLSPHIAGETTSTYPGFFRIMVDEFERFFAGHEVRSALLPRTLANRRGDVASRFG
jgi:phosphoglycerate dehydrogenase-like enzyme